MEYGPFDSSNRADEDIQQQDEIFTLLQGYFINIIVLREEVENTSKSSPRGMNITDAQWARFTNPLSQLEQPVKDFCALLELHTTHPPLPLVVEVERYSLLSILNDITKRIDDLKSCIHEYSIASRRGATEAVLAKRDEISDQLEELKSNLKEFDQLLRDEFKQLTIQNQKEAEVVDNAARQPETGSQQTISHPLPSIAQKVTHSLRLTWSTLSSGWQSYSSKSKRTEIKTKDISVVPAASKIPSNPNLLREILADADDIDLRDICNDLKFPYNTLDGKNPAERGVSLHDKLKKRNLLPDLEKVLRKYFKARFPDQ